MTAGILACRRCSSDTVSPIIMRSANRRCAACASMLLADRPSRRPTHCDVTPAISDSGMLVRSRENGTPMTRASSRKLPGTQPSSSCSGSCCTCHVHAPQGCSSKPSDSACMRASCDAFSTRSCTTPTAAPTCMAPNRPTTTQKSSRSLVTAAMARCNRERDCWHRPAMGMHHTRRYACARTDVARVEVHQVRCGADGNLRRRLALEAAMSKGFQGLTALCALSHRQASARTW
jgi:hypothetical protein